jgi:cytidylate kinase
MAMLISFAGHIGSGKSSVCHALAERLGWPRAGFGDYLRSELARQGREPTREALQNVGQALVEADAESFCRAVLASSGFEPGRDFLVDGVRHVDIQRMLAHLAPPSIPKLIFLAADGASRLERVDSRADGRAVFVRAEAHRVESELRRELPALADANVDATQCFPSVVEQCLALIRGWSRI